MVVVPGGTFKVEPDPTLVENPFPETETPVLAPGTLTNGFPPPTEGRPVATTPTPGLTGIPKPLAAARLTPNGAANGPRPGETKEYPPHPWTGETLSAVDGVYVDKGGPMEYGDDNDVVLLNVSKD